MASTNESPDHKPPLWSVINAHDFEAVAEKTFSSTTWAYCSSSATDGHTYRLNSAMFSRIWLRPRILRNVSNISTKTSLIGQPTSLPIYAAPFGMASLAHADGELAIARACKATDIIQTIPTMSSYLLSSIVDAYSSSSSSAPSPEGPSHPFFLQLYVSPSPQKTTALLAQAKDLGVKAIFLTVDSPVFGKREAHERAALSEDPNGPTIATRHGAHIDNSLTWDDLAWIHSASGGLPLVIKGIQTAADARRAATYDCVKGIVLSNHGGRSLDTSQPTLVTLLELRRNCPAVFEKVEVYLDGGVRRGTDVVKALALGAKAVGIGRPFLYALAYGRAGVEKMVEILRDEIETTMKMLGAVDVGDLHSGLLNTRDIDHLVPEDGDGRLENGE